VSVILTVFVVPAAYLIVHRNRATGRSKSREENSHE